MSQTILSIFLGFIGTMLIQEAIKMQAVPRVLTTVAGLACISVGSHLLFVFWTGS